MSLEHREDRRRAHAETETCVRARLEASRVACADDAAQRRAVTLVYSSRDAEHNNAVALKDYLNRKIGKQHRTREEAASKPRLH